LFDDEGASVSMAFNRTDFLFKPPPPISKALALARVVVGLLLFEEGAAFVFFAHF
jgi:hypothetical protein